ncbi:MAG: hypothetical protein DHS20C18_46000 [Saprospiraceae bacterium]|nr:MAG: hypothetical protein DHS20C18_46000 [Saprospiraceae bacterium]
MLRVYQIFQEKCVSCHSNANPAAGLDLEGTGSTETERLLSVHAGLNNVTPSDETAVSNGYKRVYPGRIDQSYLFHKISNGLEATIENPGPHPEDNEELTDVEKEMIRQWILYGAKSNGSQVVDESLLLDFYNGNAMRSYPDGPPPAPAAGEGFQIKMGPFYIEPGSEIEYFQKYQLDLLANVDVNRVEVKIAPFSHHFILYNFNAGGSNSIPDGLRLNADHSNISLVAAVQEETDLRLPEGTAFIWENNMVLDLNTHYINYSATNVYQAEAYVNVYTQPAGTAAQEMFTQLLPNPNIYIPNNGNPITATQHINLNFGEVFIWGLMGHTHKYGTGYKVFKRLPGGVAGELIYDASCPQGVPGCISPYYDYQHIPMRYFEPLRPTTINYQNGLIHEASWVNDGPESVAWGPTSADEMMVMVIMYTEDTTGIVSGINDLPHPINQVQVFPNPVHNKGTISVPIGINQISFRLFDATGKQVHYLPDVTAAGFSFERGNLPSGMYFFQVQDSEGRIKSGKILFE